MSQRFEGHFKSFDQSEIFFQTWTPKNVRGALLLTHGMAEHSECYHALAHTLAEDGWQVFAWDLRGHGRSEGKRGYVGHFSDYIEDFARFYEIVRGQTDARPLIFFGHSLGGLLTLRFLQTHRPEYAALVLSSPALGLSVQVPKFKEMLANFAIKWMPTITMHNEIKYEDLTRDEDMIKGYRTDTLRHDKISPGLFLSMVESFALAAEAPESIDRPVLMQLSGEDRIVSAQASRDFFERLPSKKKQLIIYPDSYHEVYNDLDRDQVVSDLKNFINRYLESA